MRKLLIIGIILALFSAIGYYFAKDYWVHRFDDLIARHAKVYGLDEKLVWSVIYQETWFRPDQTGDAGEVGLMQITPLVAKEWARETGIKEFEKQISEDFENSLKDPERSIQIGCWYLELLRQKYRDYKAQDAMALAAYNAGPSRVEEWKKDLSLTDEEFIKRINIPSTNSYVSEIMARYKQKK